MSDESPLQYPPKPRVTPISPHELAGLLDERSRGRFDDRKLSMNIYRTLGNNPKLINAWLPLGGYLLYDNDIPGYDREILILRTARNCGSAYEWEKHVRLAATVDVSGDEIGKIERYAPLSEWPEWQATLLSAADELHNDACIADDTWSKLAEQYDTNQLLAVPMLVGQYHMVAFMLQSAGVQNES